MTFKLGERSEANLIGVRPTLICCVRHAIKRSAVDFSVHEGLRSVERQKQLVASGASRTLNSYHLTGEAVDLVPYVGGRLQWQMPLCLQIARAMWQASQDLSVRLVWGGVWDRELGELVPDKLEAEIRLYTTRYHLMHPGKDPLIDGPHFQLVRFQDQEEAA